MAQVSAQPAKEEFSSPNTAGGAADADTSAAVVTPSISPPGVVDDPHVPTKEDEEKDPTPTDQDPKPYGGSGGSGGSGRRRSITMAGENLAVSFKERWSPFSPLLGVRLLGDLCDPEEFKFGETIPKIPIGRMIWQKTMMFPVMMFRILVISIIPLIIISVMALLPCYGDKEQTALTAGIAGFLVVWSGLCSVSAPPLACDTRNQGETLKWLVVGFSPFCFVGAAVQMYFHSVGKKGKILSLAAQLIILVAAVIATFAYGKMNTEPGWRPKWNTCFCVFKGVSKASTSIALTGGMVMLSVVLMVRFLREDTLLLAPSTSKSMIVVRPTLFFAVKKILYHAIATMAKVRHPILTKASNVGASAMLGVATAMLFSNTRTWPDLIFFMLGNWFTFLSKLWTLFGSKGSTQCKPLAWYSWFMSTGKPYVAPGMNKQLLRGFEIQAQNFGTTFGLVVIVAFYPIGKFAFGDQSMIYKLLFASDKSLTFLLVALLNEVIEDNFGQVVIARLTNNDFNRLYSLIPGNEVRLGMVLCTVFATVVVTSGFFFRASKAGPFAEP